MAENENASIVRHLARLIFETDDPEEKHVELAEKALGMIGQNYVSPWGKLRNQFLNGELAAEDAADAALDYILAETVSTRIGAGTSEQRREVLESVRAAKAERRDHVVATARVVLDQGDEEDRARARWLLDLARGNALGDFPTPELSSRGGDVEDPLSLDGILEAIGGAGGGGGAVNGNGGNGNGGNGNGAGNGGGDGGLPSAAEILRNALRYLAFDEARLPRSMHYDRDLRGGEVPSAGQVAFLRGVAAAIEKLPTVDSLRDWQTTVVGVTSILLLEGHHDPDDRGFFTHVRAAYNELLEPASAYRREIVPGNQAFEPGFQLKRAVMAAVADLLVPRGAGVRPGGRVFFHALASVYRGMVGQYDTRPPGSAGFDAAVQSLYKEASVSAGNGQSGVAFLDLPPLSDPASEADLIKPDNIRAIAAIYCVYQCEQALVFDVCDRVVELFMAGLYPMDGQALNRPIPVYYYNDDDRMTKAGRFAQYSRALGAPGGEIGPDVTANTQFNPSLIHSFSSCAEFERKHNIGDLFERNRGRNMALSGEYVRKALRDLAANCTLYGYAGAQFAAERMGKHLSQAIEILQLPRIREIYGVSTMWQVVERVAQSEYGVSVNVHKHITMAEEVKAFLEILAKRADVWSRSSGGSLFTIDPERPGDLSQAETDRMFRAAQYFLAVNAMPSDQVYQHSQPQDRPTTPSIPGVGMFGGGGAPAGAGGDVAGQLKSMLDAGQTPSPDQLRAMVGF